MAKDCRDCKNFNTQPDWATVDYRLIDINDLSIQETTVGDRDPTLKKFSEHEGGFGKVYTVCEKHKIVLACNRAAICKEFKQE